MGSKNLLKWLQVPYSEIIFSVAGIGKLIHRKKNLTEKFSSSLNYQHSILVTMLITKFTRNKTLKQNQVMYILQAVLMSVSFHLCIIH